MASLKLGFKQQIVQEVDSGLLWSPTGKPVAPSGTPVERNPEQKPPAKAGALASKGRWAPPQPQAPNSGSVIDRWRRQSRQGGLDSAPSARERLLERENR